MERGGCNKRKVEASKWVYKSEQGKGEGGDTITDKRQQSGGRADS